MVLKREGQTRTRILHADLRITPGWTHPRNSRNFWENSGKTGNFRKIQKYTSDLSNECSWQAGSRGHKKISEFRKILGNFWENSGKTWKKRKICRKTILLWATTPRVVLQYLSTVTFFCLRKLEVILFLVSPHCIVNYRYSKTTKIGFLTCLVWKVA